MSIRLREFQKRACERVASELQAKRSVLLVAPTGAGKTVMGSAMVSFFWRRSKRILFVAHRTELITQTAEKLRASQPGASQIGVITPNAPSTPSRPIQVGSIQTMLARGFPKSIDLLVLDEAHHYNADDWNQVVAEYPAAKVLGMTATPGRRDGRALGDVFESMVVAANYSELINLGYLVPCDVYQPERGLGSNEVAQDPLKAYRQIAPGSLAFGFASRVEQCRELARTFTDAGIPSAVIEAGTLPIDRKARLAAFRARELRVLWNVYALTEGVDVPEASTMIIARKMDHVQMYLQACGRVLRPFPGKERATIIDLSGATLKHGFPTEDREYSLTGKPIRRTSEEPLRVCVKCGATSPAWTSHCPVCGFVPPKLEAPQLKIYDHQLRKVFDGFATPETDKRKEYLRLRQVGRERGWDLYAVQREYAKLFGDAPTIDDACAEERQATIEKLRATAQQKGYKPGWANVRYKQLFGEWPQ